MTTKTNRKQRRRSAKRHARRDNRQVSARSYRDTVRELKRVATKNHESVADVLSGLRMSTILNSL